MPLNGFSVGRDVALNITTPAGPIALSLITEFKSKMDITDKKVKGLDGLTRHVRFPDGWTGTFTLQRQDSTADDYFAGIESNYYAGLNETPCTILETVSEVNGSISQYRYEGVLLRYEEAGDWKGDDTVMQSIGFVAARRLKVS